MTFVGALARAFAALVLVLSAGAVGQAAVAKQALDRSSVDAYVRDEMTKRRIPGLALAVIRHGRLERITPYGYANCDRSSLPSALGCWAVVSARIQP